VVETLRVFLIGYNKQCAKQQGRIELANQRKITKQQFHVYWILTILSNAVLSTHFYQMG